jgi:hypothetical protein
VTWLPTKKIMAVERDLRRSVSRIKVMFQGHTQSELYQGLIYEELPAEGVKELA